MTNYVPRTHLVELDEGMQSPAYSYMYKYRERGNYERLQWAEERGVDLRSFALG